MLLNLSSIPYASVSLCKETSKPSSSCLCNCNSLDPTLPLLLHSFHPFGTNFLSQISDITNPHTHISLTASGDASSPFLRSQGKVLPSLSSHGAFPNPKALHPALSRPLPAPSALSPFTEALKRSTHWRPQKMATEHPRRLPLLAPSTTPRQGPSWLAALPTGGGPAGQTANGSTAPHLRWARWREAGAAWLCLRRCQFSFPWAVLYFFFISCCALLLHPFYHCSHHSGVRGGAVCWLSPPWHSAAAAPHVISASLSQKQTKKTQTKSKTTERKRIQTEFFVLYVSLASPWHHITARCKVSALNVSISGTQVSQRTSEMRFPSQTCIFTPFVTHPPPVSALHTSPLTVIWSTAKYLASSMPPLLLMAYGDVRWNVRCRIHPSPPLDTTYSRSKHVRRSICYCMVYISLSHASQHCCLDVCLH